MAWLRYRSYSFLYRVVGLKSSLPTIPEWPFSNAGSFARSKTRSLCFVDKARSVLYLRARVVLTYISKGAYALYLLSTKRASEAFLVASLLLPHPILSFPLKLLWFRGLID